MDKERGSITTHDRAIRLGEVLGRVGVRKTKLYQMIRNGEFAAPEKLGRSSFWSERETDIWIDQRFRKH